MQKKMQFSASKIAIVIGGVCVFSYLSVYISRNILGAVTPQIIECKIFFEETIGFLSSIYFFSYAIGQLINGILGDKITSKYMMCIGLFGAGITTFLFNTAIKSTFIAFISYGFVGFFLSMIFAPMTKLIAENTKSKYASRCSLGCELASMLGSPFAGLLATFFIWKTAFNFSGFLLIFMGAICFTVFTILERRNIIKYNKVKSEKSEQQGIRVLLKNRIVKFTFIAIITGIIKTTVIFWLPTYISQYHGFSSEKSALIFTVATLVISMAPFVSVFMYNNLKSDMHLTVLVAFLISAVSFIVCYFIEQVVINIAFMIIAIIASNCAAIMLWTKYCISLRDTGMVSSATGFLDFMSYMAAAISSSLFANAVSGIGWKNLILVWFAIMIFGVVVALPYDKIKLLNSKGTMNKSSKNGQ